MFFITKKKSSRLRYLKMAKTKAQIKMFGVNTKLHFEAKSKP